MGSLRAIQEGPREVLIQKKKPLQTLLGALKADIDPNRSPLGSPPVEKKRVRRLSTMAYQGKENVEMFAYPVPILKRPARPSVSTLARPTKCSHRRRVQFHSQVQVQFIGDSESTCNEPLVVDSHDRQAFIARNVLSKSRSLDICDAFSKAELVVPEALPSCQSTSQLPVLDAPIYKQASSKNVSISFSQNSQNHTCMKFVVNMGPHYDPDNIVVKANMSGNRLRIVANAAPQHGGIVNEQYNERFQLPMQVDPYKVEARLDGRGMLTVEAPLMTVEQRRLLEQKSGSISV